MSEIINQVNLRKMEITDIIKVAEIEKASFPTPWSSYAFTCELLDNQFAHYIVMTLKDEPEKIIGYGGMWVIIDEAHVTNIAISPEYRGRRLGEILLLKMMEVAIDKGALRMTLEVRVSNIRARKLYERLGFKSAGLRKGYYVDNHEDAIIMWKDLMESISG
ncbi:MAG: ribosomal protein S18-alanine N-acetyltransferase [Clostridia bacterium]|nr:ribosomal protein S18-alanine N-acetyltransferase [Clostridia bacterium]